MKPSTLRIALLGGILCLAGFLAWAFLGPLANPVALLQVVDSAGNPVSGAEIKPDGLRTKPGPYVSGWYAWTAERTGVRNDPVTTDRAGYARVPYPKFVFERIETGTLCLSVDHPEFVPDRPERAVTFAPPSGSPWKAWADYAWNRLRHKSLVVRPDPIVLAKGATLKVTLRSGWHANGVLHAQISGEGAEKTNFWIRPSPNVLVTRKLRAGRVSIRLFELGEEGSIWFSPVTNLTAVIGQEAALELDLQPGITVRGSLAPPVARPVDNGRVIVNAWPRGENPQTYPPQWHAWAKVIDNGTFEIPNLPPGDSASQEQSVTVNWSNPPSVLEIVAICDGFVSTNGAGQFPSMHYPQKFILGTNDLHVTLGMEPTACLEVLVRDNEGKPLPGAIISAWPNVRYGEWSATLLGDDLYNTTDFFSGKDMHGWWERMPASYRGTSTVDGVARIYNLAAEAREVYVEHTRYVLPAQQTSFGEKRRQAEIQLERGRTNHISVQLEPIGSSPITHF